LGIITVDLDITDEPLIRYSHSSDTGGKNGEFNGTVHHLFIDSEKAYDVRRELLHNILI
jgi:hypothetical protein